MRFGPYELIDAPSEGVEVCRAVRRLSGDDELEVVLHRPRIGRGADEELRRRFALRARAAAGRSHLHLVQIVDHGCVDDQLYFACERLPGLTLAEALTPAARAARPPPMLLALVAVEAAIGLEALHGANGRLLHRRIHPAAIRLTPSGIVKLGTPSLLDEPPLEEFASPEQLAGEPLDPRSDVFSLARVLERCLRPGADLAPDLADALRRATHADRALRPATARKLADELLAIVHRHAPETSRAAIATWVEQLSADRAGDDGDGPSVATLEARTPSRPYVVPPAPPAPPRMEEAAAPPPPRPPRTALLLVLSATCLVVAALASRAACRSLPAATGGDAAIAARPPSPAPVISTPPAPRPAALGRAVVRLDRRDGRASITVRVDNRSPVEQVERCSDYRLDGSDRAPAASPEAMTLPPGRWRDCRIDVPSAVGSEGLTLRLPDGSELPVGVP